MTSPRLAWAGIAIAVATVAAITGCADDIETGVDGVPGVVGSADDVATTVAADDVATTVAAGVQPEGFTTIRARITEVDGTVCEVCLWLADNSDERGRGLMGVTDLGDAAGMAFRFEEAVLGTFYMFQTPTPLSIAWFGADGVHVGSAEMDPCLDTPSGDCARYSPGAEYDLAIEVFAGGLEPLGLVAGSRVELIEGSEAERCPVSP
jgi:uncharacterized membrane protein (UPF0127 family)